MDVLMLLLSPEKCGCGIVAVSRMIVDCGTFFMKEYISQTFAILDLA